MGTNKHLYMVKRAYLGNTDCNLQDIAVALLTFAKTVSKCPLKLNLKSKSIPKCFWERIRPTSALLKAKGGCNVILTVMVTCREIIDYLFNATNIRTLEARNNCNMEKNKNKHKIFFLTICPH